MAGIAGWRGRFRSGRLLVPFYFWNTHCSVSPFSVLRLRPITCKTPSFSHTHVVLSICTTRRGPLLSQLSEQRKWKRSTRGVVDIIHAYTIRLCLKVASHGDRYAVPGLCAIYALNITHLIMPGSFIKLLTSQSIVLVKEPIYNEATLYLWHDSRASMGTVLQLLHRRSDCLHEIAMNIL